MAFPTPFWRYFIGALDGTGITDLSRVVHDRTVTVLLNAPLTVTGRAASTSPAIWFPYDDAYDDPALAEGTRLLWALRRESDTPPYYSCRAATLVQFVEDDAEQDQAMTKFNGYDPWALMFNRLVVNSSGVIPDEEGLSFTATNPAVIVASLLKWSIDADGHNFIDAGTTYSGTSFYGGNLPVSIAPIDVVFAQGTTIGEAWDQLVDMGVCDIVLNPIYDPVNRPNYLVELNVYAEAGVENNTAIFAWNMPGRSLVGLNRQEDGAARVNDFYWGAGPGGVDGVGTVADGPSVAKYGVYGATQFFPGMSIAAAAEAFAAQQVAIRKNGKNTVTFKPAPLRSPRPWIDYQLGDRCPVWASADKFRKLLTGVL